jgi:15-cis-phytoene synthase
VSAVDSLSPDLADYAARTLESGSTSFAAAARLLDGETRESAALLYAWCRHCDDAIDGQTLGHAARPASGRAASILSELERDTRAALLGRPSSERAFQALALVSARHALPPSLPLAHLDGFRMDVEGRRYESLEDLLAYCWGVAGVVGVMMARVMGVQDRDTLDRAADLGLAFQLTNIARDVAEDARAGRIYLPVSWLRGAGVPPSSDGILDPEHAAAVSAVAARLVAEAEPFYASALVGIGRLPLRSAAAIGAARAVYRAIGWKVVRGGAQSLGVRVRTSGAEKLLLVASGTGRALSARAISDRPRDPHLWRQQAVGDC